MEFLKSCNTNAQAIGDFEAIAYQAFSVSSNLTQPSSRSLDPNTPTNSYVAEAKLRQRGCLVVSDTTRPWLWLFQPSTVDKVGHHVLPLPELDGIQLQREQSGFTKAAELARPPVRSLHPSAAFGAGLSNASAATQRNLHGGSARLPQGDQATSVEQQPVPDCCTIYELFTSAVTALILFNIVKDCNVIAINYRTFISKSSFQRTNSDAELRLRTDLLCLTSLNVHWTGSGTLLVSTYTRRNTRLRCLDEVALPTEENKIVGSCIRIAPNGLLARVASFDSPTEPTSDDVRHRLKKKARGGDLEQDIENWKTKATEWLTWKGYDIPDLDKPNSWVRIHISLKPTSTLASPVTPSPFRDILWPRAMCFAYTQEHVGAAVIASNGLAETTSCHEGARSSDDLVPPNLKDPLVRAQEWFLGKSDRDKTGEAKLMMKRAEEDAARRKEEFNGLFPSSPINSRSVAYGDLQAVSGVYPTPPDGIAPGAGFSNGDTPSVLGAPANNGLASGGSMVSMNVSGPLDIAGLGGQPAPLSPTFPATSDSSNLSAGNDDLFGDIEEDGSEVDGINDADFDFFDGPDEDDIAMLEAPQLAESKILLTKNNPTSNAQGEIAHSEEHEASDSLAALENLLVSVSPAVEMMAKPKDDKDLVSTTVETSLAGIPEVNAAKEVSQSHDEANRARQATPPLSPGMIAKILHSNSKTVRDMRNQHQREVVLASKPDSVFGPINFSRRLSITDAKYQDANYDTERRHETHERPISRHEHSQVKSLRDLPLLNRLRYAISVASAQAIPTINTITYATDDDISDSASDLSDESKDGIDVGSETESRPIIHKLVLPTKRKWHSDDNATPLTAMSFAESLKDDRQDLQDLNLDETQLPFLEANSWDWSLVNSPSPSEHPIVGTRFTVPSLMQSITEYPDTLKSVSKRYSPSDGVNSVIGKEGIAVSQILTEQIVAATLDLFQEDHSYDAEDKISAAVETRWHKIIKRTFPNATQCRLPALSAIHDVFPDLTAQAKGQQRPPPRKQHEGAAIPGSQMCLISPPFLRVRRAETHWDLLPPAIAYWEPLGLSPVSPPKNVVAFSVYPYSDMLKSSLETFLLNLQLTYDSCKLGIHTRVENISEYVGGLVPIQLSSEYTEQQVFKAMHDTCIQFGKFLALQYSKIREQHDSKLDAFVIYMVNPFKNQSALWELCSAFWSLFQSYGQGPIDRYDQNPKPDLILQVIPIQYLASGDVPIVLDPSTYVKLAREVYDRCPPSAPLEHKSTLSIYTAPAFQLEEALPRGIPFKLISEPPPDLLRENGYMHLAYAVSLDGTWITAAWTDSCGKSQAVVSYHLGTRVFAEVAKDIWQTTIEILQSRRVHWRVCIAKAGVMDREEFETWAFLISCPTHLNLFITLLTVDTSPAYRFSPPSTVPIATGNQVSLASPDTDTALQSGVSPDAAFNLTPAATPSAEMPTGTDLAADPEVRLVDITDETWGVILAHRLHNSESTTQFVPALISGLLVKKGETIASKNTVNHPTSESEQGPIIVGVNILWIGAVGSTRAATSPFPPSNSDGVSPVSANPTASNPTQEGGTRSMNSLVWTPTVQTRATAENLLKELLGQFRGLGLLAKLRGMRATRHGTVPWHVAAAQRGVTGLAKVMGVA